MKSKNFSIQEMVNKAIADENSKRVKKEQTSWHPSSLGGCLTGVYLSRWATNQTPEKLKELGISLTKEFDERTLRVFHCGNVFEEWIVELLRKQYQNIERQVRILIPELNVSGYADLVVNFDDGSRRIYEVKSKNSKAFWYMTKEGNANLHHRMQVWLYLKALNLSFGNIVYISKDDMAIQEYSVRLDEKELEEVVMQELSILNKAWDTKVPPPAITNEKDWRFKYCQTHQVCLDTINNPKKYK